MDHKKYKFETLNQIANVVNDDNIEYISSCIAQWLFHYNYAMKKVKKDNPELKDIPNSQIAEAGFILIDDKDNRLIGTIITNKETGEVTETKF